MVDNMITEKEAGIIDRGLQQVDQFLADGPLFMGGPGIAAGRYCMWLLTVCNRLWSEYKESHKAG
jgi:hypothetical protein